MNHEPKYNTLRSKICRKKYIPENICDPGVDKDFLD